MIVRNANYILKLKYKFVYITDPGMRGEGGTQLLCKKN